MTLTVCVTGASGYLGSHVTRALLERGCTVRATVRDASNPRRTEHLTRLAENLPGALELVAADLERPGSFDAAVAGCQQVYHTASPVYLTSRDPRREVVEPAVRGMENVLAAVERAGTVEALGVTSSAAAITDTRPRPGHVYTERDWNRDATVEHNAYGLSKRLSERALWQWHERQPDGGRPALMVVNPVFVFGPVYARVHLRTSPAFVKDALLGAYHGCPRIAFHVVDVRDVTAALLLGVERGLTGRFLLCSEVLWLQQIAELLAAAFPEYRVPTHPLPDPLVYLAALVDQRISLAWVRDNLNHSGAISNAKLVSELGITPRPAAESVLDTARSMMELGFVSPERTRRNLLDTALEGVEGLRRRLWPSPASGP